MQNLTRNSFNTVFLFNSLEEGQLTNQALNSPLKQVFFSQPWSAFHGSVGLT